MTSPSATIIDGANAVLVVKDAEGREVTVRRPNALDKLRLFKAVGPVLATNEAYLGMAALACAVNAIDGVPVPFPANEAQLEGLVSRLGDSGLTAAAEVLGLATAESEPARVAAGN